jgi:hypothetical protein
MDPDPINEGSCEQEKKLPLLAQFKASRERLQLRLNRVNAAIEALEANPTLEAVYCNLRAADRY